MPISDSYLAGFFDGEGCIVMRKRKEGTCRVSIEIRNTSPEVLQCFVDKFGGSSKPCSLGVNMPIYEFRLNKIKDCFEFLSVMEPLLIEKREQAKLALEWLRHRLTYSIRATVVGNRIMSDGFDSDKTISSLKLLKRRIQPNIGTKC